jgi:adenine deaminase
MSAPGEAVAARPRAFAGLIADVHRGRFYPGRFRVEAGRIRDLHEDSTAPSGPLFAPGLVDAHLHIESTLLSPAEFGRFAPVHGTVATVSDPHEIANVAGIAGVDWMIAAGRGSPVKIAWGAPSCVPATPLDPSGASFGPEEIHSLLERPEIRYLAEVMNFPGVIGGDPTMEAILAVARQHGVPLDGHAPGVRGEDLRRYAAAGISTDHESFTLEEGREKIAAGLSVAIREGSAARNFEALWPLLQEHPDHCFFCSDDRHPDDLVESHIDGLVRRAIALGIDPMVALRAATLHPVRHYRLPVGLLQEGDPADFVVVPSADHFHVEQTWIDGRLVAERGRPRTEARPVPPLNVFRARPVGEGELSPAGHPDRPMLAIRARDGEIVTDRETVRPRLDTAGRVRADPSRDQLKIAVVDRYRPSPPAVGLVLGFGLERGAIAGSVAHDCHHVIGVGADEDSLRRALNAVIAEEGSLALAAPGEELSYPLPLAGLMGELPTEEAARRFRELTARAHGLGCSLQSPFMTLSFLALVVIPSLKISAGGLFDVDRFGFIDPWQD